MASLDSRGTGAELMLDIGKNASLEVLRAAPMGLILGDAEHEVLLPTRYVPQGISPGDQVEVFLYTDSEDRPIATTEQPLAQADEFACLRVVSVNSTGAFLDWGLPKDLLLPFRLQLCPVRLDQRIVVRVFCDQISRRPVATSKIERFLEPPPADLRPGQLVQLLIYERTELGSKAIVNGSFGGLLYRESSQESHSESGKSRLRKQPAIVGATPTAYVQRVRPDGKVDLRLGPTGKAGIDKARETLLAALGRAGGRLDLTDRSEPEEIRRALGLSKKAFKRAVGALYRERLIRIGDSSIELLEPPSES